MSLFVVGVRYEIIVNNYADSTDGDCQTVGSTTCNLRAAANMIGNDTGEIWKDNVECLSY